MPMFPRLASAFLLAAVGACATAHAPAPLPAATPAPPPAPTLPEIAPDIASRLIKLPATQMDYDHALLGAPDTSALSKLIEASRLIDEVFSLQVSEKNPAMRKELVEAAKLSQAHRLALEYFDIMHGPWDRLAMDQPFVAPFGEKGTKPLGAGFYPPDLTKQEFEGWLAAHPNDKDAFQSSFTVIRREGAALVAIPFSQAYKAQLEPAAARLREAAALTTNTSLKHFLETRAAAFLSNDYYDSDIAWMDLDSPIEVVIGPYEVYEDGLFNYKASFESFVCVVDKGETDKLSVYVKHLAAMDKNLPLDAKYRRPRKGTASPIRVVQEAFTAGDARNGVQTAAFNLPNDERVREAKGAKKVMLKNVMEAKFSKSGKPISERVLDFAQASLVKFEPYFTYVLFHELSHTLGPGVVKGADGKDVEVRIPLKELYSTIEECKADVAGGWSVLYALDKGVIKSFGKESFFATDVGLLFRSMRFGIDEAHGRGSAVQWNWYREKGAIVPTANGTYHVESAKMKTAMKSLLGELLLIEATGDYSRGKNLLDKYGVTNPEIDAVIAKLADLPTDIDPVFTAAGETMP
jgi:hypothetical protein